MTRTLLPPWHGPAEAALAETAAMLPLPVPIPPLWDAQACPAPLLPWLAWTLDAEDYDPDAPEDVRRRVIAEAIVIHRRRGTKAGVQHAVRAAGFGDAKIIERYGTKIFNAATPRDGTQTRAAADHWAEYRVILSRPVTTDQAARARAVIERAAPARCHLKALDFSEAALIYDATAPRDGTYTRGYA
jgi:phage tail P2-like protein